MTKGQSFNIAFGAAPSSLEALRRLIRRWDPLSGGKRRALLRQILVADRCELQDFPAGLQKWEALVCRCERSTSGGTTTAALKTAALEPLTPIELEQHLPTNRARVITCDQVRNEIQAYLEARRSQFAFLAVAAKNTTDPTAVDSIGTGGKKEKWKRQARERRWEGHERQRSGAEAEPESDLQFQLGRSLLALWKEGSLEHRTLGETQEQSVGPRMRPSQHSLTEENRKATRATEQVLWNKETKLQLRNHSRNQLSRSLLTWQRLSDLRNHQMWIQKVGGDGHMTRLRQLRLFHWTSRLARSRKRMNAAARLHQENSSLSMAVCVCRERRSTGMQRPSKTGRQTIAKL